jgi:hypothetical protein
VNPAGELPQLRERPVELLRRALEQRPRRGGVAVELRERQAERERECDEPLLSSVVQVALELTARGVAGLDDTRAPGEQLLPRVGARESQADELGEVAQAWKTSRGSAPEATRVATRRSAACSFTRRSPLSTMPSP